MTKRISAEEVGQNFGALLEEVQTSHEEIAVTKGGRMIAKIIPAREVTLEEMRGSLKIVGDIESPLDENWEADAE